MNNKQPRKIWLVIFISWIAFHLFALLMVNTGIEFFHVDDAEGAPKTEKFWPFVDFIRYGSYLSLYNFGGIFHHYDITEFAFYVGIAVFAFLIVKILKN